MNIGSFVQHFETDKMRGGVEYASYTFDLDGGYYVTLRYYGRNKPLDEQFKAFANAEEALSYIRSIDQAFQDWQQVGEETGRGYHTYFYERVLEQ